MWCDSTIDNNITVANYGNDTAKNLVLTIKYPGKVVAPVSSTIPWDSYLAIDSLMTFTFNTLPPDSIIKFTITDSVHCNKSFYDTALTYKMYVSATNDCYPDDSTHRYFEFNTSTGVGINPIKAVTKSLQLYPNPSNGIVSVKGLEEPGVISVYDIHGRKIHDQRITGYKTHSINLTGQHRGLYFILIRTEDAIYKGKVLIEK